MSDLQQCPQCGAELLKDAPAGLCPKCLVAAGSESEPGSPPERPDSDAEAPTIDSPSPASGFLPPAPGELANKFPQLEILELLGHGGMGAVYKARQTNLDRLVALKIIRPEATHDPAFAERFNREAKTLARLSHQHIVAVHDFGEVEYCESENQPTRPLYYFLMEYVDGANLRQMMRAGEMTPEQALAIVPQICGALQYAHDEGVVHRDIKPENILLDKRGRVKIADFGLAKLARHSEAEITLTGTHQVIGTLRYMAPEQMEGSRAVDHRADIYSLGVVFYEMLTGELPIGRFSAPSEKVKIDVRLDEVVLRTLAKEPERRYQHASQVKSDVDSITSSNQPALGPAVEWDVRAGRQNKGSEVASLERRALAGRLLLLRRELMGRIEKSLRPLFWGQILQMLAGIGIIALGVYCWAPNRDIPHRLASGVVLHAYGTLVILAAGVICMRIKRLDYSKAAHEIRDGLDGIRNAYLRFGAFLGLAWWLVWMPLAVAVGFDAVVYPPAIWISTSIGAVGFVLSLVVFVRVLKSESQSAERWRSTLAGESLRAAHLALNEIVDADIV